MKWIQEYYPYLQSDIEDVLGYIPASIITGALGTLVILILYRIGTGSWQWKKGFCYLLFLTYLMAVVQITYLSRLPGSRTGIELGLGATWGTTVQAHSYVIENVLLFVPFGILFPMLGRVPKRICIPVAILVSSFIEGMQYLTQRGFCQLDDVVANSLGAIIGYMIIILLKRLQKIMKRRIYEEKY